MKTTCNFCAIFIADTMVYSQQKFPFIACYCSASTQRSSIYIAHLNEHFKLSCAAAIALAEAELSRALKLWQELWTHAWFSTVASSKLYEQREFSLCFFTSAGFLFDSISWSSRTFPGGLSLLCACSAHPYKGYRNCVVFLLWFWYIQWTFYWDAIEWHAWILQG